MEVYIPYMRLYVKNCHSRNTPAYFKSSNNKEKEVFGRAVWIGLKDKVGH
jgi:hypothetical protein